MATDASPWQRFWRSPWLWLVLTLINWWSFSTVHSNVRGIYFAAAVICSINFFVKGDAKWGRP